MTLGKLKFTLLVHIYHFGQAKVILLRLGKMGGHEKQSQPLWLAKKFKKHAQDLAQVIFSDSISRNQELGSQVNKYTSKINLLFLPVTRFSDLCYKLKLEHNQTSMMEHFCKNSYVFLPVNFFFCKKAPPPAPPHYKCSTVFQKGLCCL